MAPYQFYGYAAAALSYNAPSGAFELAADYDPLTDRILVTITDGDAYFDGDAAADEVGDDAGQTALVTTPDGIPIAQGKIYDEAFAVLTDAASQSAIYLERLEIGGVHLGYFVSEKLVPGQSYPLASSDEVTSSPDNRLTYDNVCSVPCFASGTRIATSKGEKPIERLVVGDRVMTLDHGCQPLLWSGRFTAPPDSPGTRPVEVTFAPGSLGPGLPCRPLRVTGCHRILLSGTYLARHFGESEVLAAAKYLAGGPGIVRRSVTRGQQFHRLLLPDHEVILADGVWSESLFAGGNALEAQPADLQRHLKALAPKGHRQTARLCLRRWEVEMIRPTRETGCGQRAA